MAARGAILDVLHGGSPCPGVTTAVHDLLDAAGPLDGPVRYAVDGCELLVMPGRRQLVGEARRWVGRATSGLAAVSGREDELMVAVSEAATNAVEHAHEDEQQGTFVVVVCIEPAVLRVLIGDDGIWDASEPEASRGRGTALMIALSDAFQRYSDAHGTVVVLSFGPAEIPSRD